MRELRVTGMCSGIDGDGARRLSATFAVGLWRREVWFRVPDGPVNERADPFLPVALVPAMRRGWRLVIDGPVSAPLLAGAEAVQDTLASWYPDFRRVPVTVAEAVAGRTVAPGSSAAFFSGGVDSFYTFQRHRATVASLLFVHGFDLPLERAGQRRQASGSLRGLAGALDSQLLEVQTNLRRFGDRHVSWPRAYVGSAMVAVALLLAPRFGTFYLASSLPAAWLAPRGTHPLLDTRWSDGALRLVHDGLEATRFEKVRALARWPVVEDHLRVCFQPHDGGLNCGRCRKCLWTMALLRAAGWLERVSTFDVPLDLAALARTPPRTPEQQGRFEQALAWLERRDDDPELQAALRVALNRVRPPPSRSLPGRWIGSLARRLRSR